MATPKLHLVCQAVCVPFIQCQNATQPPQSACPTGCVTLWLCSLLTWITRGVLWHTEAQPLICWFAGNGTMS